MKVVLFLVVIFLLTMSSFQSLEEDIYDRINNKNNSQRILSRKRRYLSFPEGSNLQLVYCLTQPSIGMGRIFTVGTTAALAWELPHDPFKSPFTESEPAPPTPPPHSMPSDAMHRLDKPSATWTMSSSPVVSYSKNYYQMNKPLNSYNFSPKVSSRTSYSTIKLAPGTKYLKSYKKATAKKGVSQKINSRGTTRYGGTEHGYRSQHGVYGGYEISKQPITTYVHPVYHPIHRRTRRQLYTKLEKLLSTLGRTGKSCLLKAICEVSQAKTGKGTFTEEIIKAIFRPKPDDTYEEDHYDKAVNGKVNCLAAYPDCKHSVWSTMFGL